jgi:hypothetical protein
MLEDETNERFDPEERIDLLLIYLPPMQSAFGTAALSPVLLAVLAPFPLIVWGSDELRRWWLRRRDSQRQERVACGSTTALRSRACR